MSEHERDRPSTPARRPRGLRAGRARARRGGELEEHLDQLRALPRRARAGCRPRSTCCPLPCRRSSRRAASKRDLMETVRADARAERGGPVLAGWGELVAPTRAARASRLAAVAMLAAGRSPATRSTRRTGARSPTTLASCQATRRLRTLEDGDAATLHVAGSPSSTRATSTRRGSKRRRRVEPASASQSTRTATAEADLGELLAGAEEVAGHRGAAPGRTLPQGDAVLLSAALS